MALALVLALSLATLAAPASFMGGEIAGGQAPGDFSMYVFAMSWKPQWCHGASSKQPGCMRPRDYWLSHMTLHGLWPDNGDGTYPTKCTAEAFDYDLVTSAIGLDKLEKLWPNVQKSEGSSDYESFWEHEWTKHGTCTGLSQVQYFETAMKVLTAVGTPDSIVENIGGSVARSEIEAFYGGEDTAILVCSSSYLSQIYLCFDKQPGGEGSRVGDQIACPPQLIQHDDSCPRDVVNIDDMTPQEW